MRITGENLTPDLRQQVELLCATPVGSVVLDRDFGLDMSFIDEPVSVAVNMAAAEISVKLENTSRRCSSFGFRRTMISRRMGQWRWR